MAHPYLKANIAHKTNKTYTLAAASPKQIFVNQKTTEIIMERGCPILSDADPYDTTLYCPIRHSTIVSDTRLYYTTLFSTDTTPVMKLPPSQLKGKELHLARKGR